MNTMHIVTVGAKVLREKATPVTTENTDIPALFDSMTAMLKKANGLGLAAPQVGISRRLFILDTGYLDYDRRTSVDKEDDVSYSFRTGAFINPEIISADGTQSIDEGCLSVPEYRAKVERAARITACWTDRDGEEHTEEFSDLAAIAFQHELDHINGILFIDRLSRLKRNMAKKKTKKTLQQYRDENNDAKIRLYGLT